MKILSHSVFASTSNGLSNFWNVFNTDDQDCDEWSADAEDKQFSNNYQWLHWGPISATLLVVFVGFSTSLVHVSWWDISTLSGALVFMLFLLWNYLVLRYLYVACLLGAGYSKIGWHPQDEEEWEYFRYCYRCLAFKAPRVHHCSKCNRCVLLMDHHCPWINNCVGQRNQIYFIKFLFVSIVGSVHAAVVLTSCLYQVIFFFMLQNPDSVQQHPLQSPPDLSISSFYLLIASIFAVGLSYGVIIAVGILLIVQLRSIYLDRTGIESLKDK
ncbi:hypothetical protein niasHS_012189 [Heterodera schachtii]|uniref:Palmitoyltransferase n=1 Tax=Heterodera schachtii TaxID=97005 RepID=A0ABD2IMP2_HETSC